MLYKKSLPFTFLLWGKRFGF